MHITRVRSCKLDAWELKDIQVLEAVGNKVANNYFEAQGVGPSQRPSLNSSEM